MKAILVLVYVAASIFALVCGYMYKQVETASYMIVAALLLHLALSLFASLRPLLDAGRIAAATFISLSALIVSALLLVYGLTQSGGWFLGAIGMTILTILVTMVISIALVRREPEEKK
jgi:peptidoglycan/LPS O-acetylase OafA/YrhL